MTDEDDLAPTVPKVDAGPAPLATTVPAPQVQARSDVPTTVPFRTRYRTDEVLGRGGMGVVHACHDSVIGRDVALKESLGDDRWFLREARVQAQLEHPSIVPAHTKGVIHRDLKPSNVMAMPPDRVMWYLLATNCAAVAFFGVYLTRVRQTLERAQEQVFLQRWLVERMLPRGVLTGRQRAVKLDAPASTSRP